jgi:hypothetical protein
VLDLAAEAAAHIAGKDAWLEGDVLYEGALSRETLFGGLAGGGGGGEEEGEDDGEPSGWWELRKNSLAVRLGGAAAQQKSAAAIEYSSAGDDAEFLDGITQQSLLSDYELLIPLADVRDMALVNVDGSRADLDDSGVSAAVTTHAIFRCL